MVVRHSPRARRATRSGPERDLALQSESCFREAAEYPARSTERHDGVERARELAQHSGRASVYADLQKFVGVLAITLPFVLLIGHGIDTGNWAKTSMSYYYYSHLRTWFVGSLFAMGLSFIAYNYKPLVKEYRWDNILTWIAGLAAIGVALCPTLFSKTQHGAPKIISGVHLGSACVLFFVLGILAFCFFTKHGPDLSPRKKRRNLIYRGCGGVIFAAIGLIIVSDLLKWKGDWSVLFIGEAIATIAFGIAWLVKGGWPRFLADP